VGGLKTIGPKLAVTDSVARERFQHPEMCNRKRGLHIFLLSKANAGQDPVSKTLRPHPTMARESEEDLPALGDFWKFFSIIAHLDMVQPKFCIKTFETCSYVTNGRIEKQTWVGVQLRRNFAC